LGMDPTIVFKKMQQRLDHQAHIGEMRGGFVQPGWPRTNIRVTRGNYDIIAFYQAPVRYICDRYRNTVRLLTAIALAVSVIVSP
jgi:hypothetical protein